mgnify:CR=1 FL=1
MSIVCFYFGGLFLFIDFWKMFFLIKIEGKPDNKDKMEILYRHIIYQNFQKNIFYNMNFFVRSNKIHTNLNKSNSAIALIKSNKNHFKNTKMISN